MKPETLKEAIAEAKRFIKIAEKVEIKTMNGTGSMLGKKWPMVVDYTKESSACKRASMDLTRVLAELRRA